MGMPAVDGLGDTADRAGAGPQSTSRMANSVSVTSLVGRIMVSLLSKASCLYSKVSRLMCQPCVNSGSRSESVKNPSFSENLSVTPRCD
jgi:hypothetical protein